MNRILAALFAIALSVPFVARGADAPPVQTINVEEAERIDVERSGPAVEPVSMTQLEVLPSLIDVREDFIAEMMDTAEGL
jgi:hypothetical protein